MLWMIILTTVLINPNSSSSISVATLKIGYYKSPVSCMQYANALTKREVLALNTNFRKDVTAVCVPVEVTKGQNGN